MCRDSGAKRRGENADFTQGATTAASTPRRRRRGRSRPTMRNVVILLTNSRGRRDEGSHRSYSAPRRPPRARQRAPVGDLVHGAEAKSLTTAVCYSPGCPRNFRPWIRQRDARPDGRLRCPTCRGPKVMLTRREFPSGAVRLDSSMDEARPECRQDSPGGEDGRGAGEPGESEGRESHSTRKRKGRGWLVAVK